MTIKHIVLLSFKPTLEENKISEIMQALGDLRREIPQIQNYWWGVNNSPEGFNRNYHHGFVMEFKNDADRKIYLEHPSHIRIAQELVKPALIDGFNSALVFDYEHN